jgi:hypothetical protein
MTDIKSFYFDTALVAPSGIPSLMGTVPLGQIVFGTDYPYASETVSKTFDANLDYSMLLAPDQVDMINRGAAKLIPGSNTTNVGHPFRRATEQKSRTQDKAATFVNIGFTESLALPCFCSLEKGNALMRR